MGYSIRLTARVLLYAPSHRQDSTYHSLFVFYTSRWALAGTRNSSMGPLHEVSIWRPIAPWANALTTELHLAPIYSALLKIRLRLGMLLSTNVLWYLTMLGCFICSLMMFTSLWIWPTLSFLSLAFLPNAGSCKFSCSTNKKQHQIQWKSFYIRHTEEHAKRPLKIHLHFSQFLISIKDG